MRPCMLASCIVGFHAVSSFHMSQDSLLGNGAAQNALGFPMLIHKQDNPPQINLSSMSSLKNLFQDDSGLWRVDI